LKKWEKTDDGLTVLVALARGEGRRLALASIHGALGGRRTGTI
jgi:hypothetical protein